MLNQLVCFQGHIFQFLYYAATLSITPSFHQVLIMLLLISILTRDKQELKYNTVNTASDSNSRKYS